MLEHLIDYFLVQPRRLVALGRGLINLSGLLTVAAAVGHVATTAASVAHGIGGVERRSAMLDELIPGIPTWWVPESVGGLLLAALIALGGAVALLTGRKYEKFLR